MRQSLTIFSIFFVFTLACSPRNISEVSNEEKASRKKKEYPQIVSPRFEDGTLSAELNEIFRRYIEPTLARQSEVTPSEEEMINYIPPDLKEAIDKNKRTHKTQNIDISGIGAFYQLFDKRDLDTTLAGMQLEKTAILRNYYKAETSFGLVPLQDKDAFFYSVTRRGVIDAALAGSLEVPYTKIKLAAQGEKSRDKALLVLYGDFVSPLINDLHNPSNYMQLWDIYFTNPDLDGNAIVLKSFSGVLAKEISDQFEYRKLEASLGVNIKGGLANLTADASGKYSSETISSFTNWTTIVDVNASKWDPDNNKNFLELPDASSIASNFDVTFPAKILNTDLNFVLGLAHKKQFIAEFFISNIPSSSLNWITTNNCDNIVGNPNLTVTPATYEGLQGVKFSFQFEPDQDKFNPQGDGRIEPIDICLEAKYKNKVNNKELVKSFKLPLNPSVDPIIRPTLSQFKFLTDVRPLPEHQPQYFTPRWEVFFEIISEDNNAIIADNDANRIAHTFDVLDAIESVDIQGGTVEMLPDRRFKINFSYTKNIDETNLTEKPVPINISGTLQIPTDNGIVERKYSIVINVPQKLTNMPALSSN